MAKVLLNGNRKKEKGLTLIETVISLAVIVIVSITAVSVSVYTNNIQKSVEIERYFTVLVDQSLSLYQEYSDSNFERAFNVLTKQTITYGNDHTYYLNLDFSYCEEAYSAYSVKYDFTASPASLKVIAMYDGGEVIVEGSTRK